MGCKAEQKGKHALLTIRSAGRHGIVATQGRESIVN
jgi:hypothetical protein